MGATTTNSQRLVICILLTFNIQHSYAFWGRFCGWANGVITQHKIKRSIQSAGEARHTRLDLTYVNPHLDQAQQLRHLQVRAAIDEATGRIPNDKLDPRKPGRNGWYRDQTIRNRELFNHLENPRNVTVSSGSTSGMGVVDRGQNQNLLDGAIPVNGSYGMHYNPNTNTTFVHTGRDDGLSRSSSWGGRYSIYDFYLVFDGTPEDYAQASTAATAFMRERYLQQLMENNKADLLDGLFNPGRNSWEKRPVPISEEEFLQMTFEEGLGESGRKIGATNHHWHLSYLKEGEVDHFVRETERGNPSAGIEVLFAVQRSARSPEEIKSRLTELFPDYRLVEDAEYVHSSGDSEHATYSAKLLPQQDAEYHVTQTT